MKPHYTAIWGHELWRYRHRRENQLYDERVVVLSIGNCTAHIEARRFDGKVSRRFVKLARLDIVSCTGGRP